MQVRKKKSPVIVTMECDNVIPTSTWYEIAFSSDSHISTVVKACHSCCLPTSYTVQIMIVVTPQDAKTIKGPVMVKMDPPKLVPPRTNFDEHESHGTYFTEKFGPPRTYFTEKSGPPLKILDHLPEVP